jgi:predicted O-methyltransferase YrrM
MSNLISEKLEAYIAAHSTAETENLAALNRETYLKVMMPEMLSGHVQGKFLEFISMMIQPDMILEIGTFTGYSGICLSKGLQPGGKIITIDINEELTPMVKKYSALEKVEHLFDIRIGKAVEIIPALDEIFDLVFIDADKINYSNYFDLVIEKVRAGGWILADNTLWEGHVLDEQKDKNTAAIDAFNKKIASDKRVENVIVSIRDGITIARKIG